MDVAALRAVVDAAKLDAMEATKLANIADQNAKDAANKEHYAIYADARYAQNKQIATEAKNAAQTAAYAAKIASDKAKQHAQYTAANANRIVSTADMMDAALQCIIHGFIVQTVYPALGLGNYRTYCPGEHITGYHESIIGQFFKDFNYLVRNLTDTYDSIDQFRDQCRINLRISGLFIKMFATLPDTTLGIENSRNMIISSIKQFKRPLDRVVHSSNTKLEQRILNALIMYLVLNGDVGDLINQLEQIGIERPCNRVFVRYQIKRLTKLLTGTNPSYLVCAHYERLYSAMDYYSYSKDQYLLGRPECIPCMNLAISKLDTCPEPEFVPIYQECRARLQADMDSQNRDPFIVRIPSFDSVYESY